MSKPTEMSLSDLLTAIADATARAQACWKAHLDVCAQLAERPYPRAITPSQHDGKWRIFTARRLGNKHGVPVEPAAWCAQWDWIGAPNTLAEATAFTQSQSNADLALMIVATEEAYNATARVQWHLQELLNRFIGERFVGERFVGDQPRVIKLCGQLWQSTAHGWSKVHTLHDLDDNGRVTATRVAIENLDDDPDEEDDDS